MSSEAKQVKKGFTPPENDNLQEAFYRFLKGILIGIGAILPGLSGGVLAVIFKVYTPIMRFLGRPFYKLKKNISYFLPLGLGGVLGIFLFAFFVSAALGAYEAFFTCLFIGLVVGTFPSLYTEAGIQGRKASDFAYMILASLFIFSTMLFGERTFFTVETNSFVWFMVGALVGLGVIVPGLSPSNFLLYFGLYKKMSDAIKGLEFQAIIPLALGAVCSVLLLAKPINYLLDRKYSVIYHTILGLVVGSSLAIGPTVISPSLAEESLLEMGLSLWQAILICILFLLLGVLISYLFSRLEDRTKAVNK